MPVEFLGMGATNDGSEANRRSNGSFATRSASIEKWASDESLSGAGMSS